MSKLLRWFGAICVATVITQLILFGYFGSRGTLNTDSVTKIIALVNGIDITGNRLQQILDRERQVEQPDFNEILESRKLAGLDMDMRIRSMEWLRNENASMLGSLKEETQRFDERRDAFDKRLEEIQEGVQQEGVKQVQRTLQSLAADQAKDQLLRMYDDERIDDVVNIIQAMPTDKRKDILGEFVTPEEADKLHEILRRIGDATPTTTLIDQAGGNP